MHVADSHEGRPMRRWRDFFLMMGVQFTYYMILTVNFRAIAHQQYVAVAFTEAGAVLSAYIIVRKIAKNDNPLTVVGMIVGGVLAGLLGTYLTRTWG